MSRDAAEVSFAPQWRTRAALDLLLNLVHAELTARYKTATFGVLWFLLNPALMTVVLAIVFQEVIRLSIDHYGVFLLAALLPWTFFQLGLANAVTALTRAPAMVKRIRIPRALLPLAAVLASLVHFLLSLVLLGAVLAALGLAPPLRVLATLPLVVAVQVTGLVGLGLLTASLNVLYRDVEHLVAVVLRLGFWLTPIFYPLSYVPAEWRGLALLNPMTGVIENYRDVLVRRQLPDASALAVSAALAVLLLCAGAFLFRRVDPQADDHV